MYPYSPSVFYQPQGQMYPYQMSYDMMDAPEIYTQPMFFSVPTQNFNKTKLCVYFSRQGYCTKGNSCRFAHGTRELQIDHQTINQTDLSQSVHVQPVSTGSSTTFPVPSSSLESKSQSSTSSNSTYDQTESGSDGEDGTPQNFKTKLCRHFSNTGRCPMQSHCGFAHGPEELQDTSETLVKKSLDERHKTKLCDNFAKGGTMDCPYRWKCRFVHDTDKEYFQKFYADTEEFHRKQHAFKNSVQELHQRKLSTSSDDEADALDQEIMRMVVEWNKKHPKGRHYYDFHGLTVDMAQDYIEDIVDTLLAEEVKEARIETGRGRHSVNGFAAIRAILLNGYQGYRGASFEPETGNDGVLILTFP